MSVVEAQCAIDAARHVMLALQQSGIEHVVLSPGSRNTPLVLAAAHDAKHCHVILDERQAAFVALGLARATAKPVALICTSGSALMHYYPAVAEAFHSQIPLVIISADRPPEMQHTGFAQTTEQAHVLRTHVHRAMQLPLPEPQVPASVFYQLTLQACEWAVQSHVIGPVHLNMPFREPFWHPEVQMPALPTPLPVYQAQHHAALPQQAIAHVATWLRQHERGVIVCGPPEQCSSEPELKQWQQALVALAECLQWPIIADGVSGMRSCEATSACIVTRTHSMLQREPHGFTPTAVLLFGQTPTSKRVSQWLQALPASAICHVTPTTMHTHARLDVPWRVMTRPAQFLRDLVSHLSLHPKTSVKSTWLSTWQQAEEQFTQKHRTLTQSTWFEGTVAQVLFESWPAQGLIQVGSSMPIRDVDAFSGQHTPGLRVFSNRGLNGIDGTLATATGLALAHQQPVALLMGDLTCLHDIGSMRLAVELQLPITCVVLANGGGTIFDFLPIAQHPTHFKTFFRTPHAMNISAIAQAFGWHTFKVNNRSSLQDALIQACEHKKPCLIEAVIDPDINLNAHRLA